MEARSNPSPLTLIEARELGPPSEIKPVVIESRERDHTE